MNLFYALLICASFIPDSNGRVISMEDLFPHGIPMKRVPLGKTIRDPPADNSKLLKWIDLIDLGLSLSLFKDRS